MKPFNKINVGEKCVKLDGKSEGRHCSEFKNNTAVIFSLCIHMYVLIMEHLFEPVFLIDLCISLSFTKQQDQVKMTYTRIKKPHVSIYSISKMLVLSTSKIHHCIGKHISMAANGK